MQWDTEKDRIASLFNELIILLIKLACHLEYILHKPKSMYYNKEEYSILQ
jgi:hypothetical protein